MRACPIRINTNLFVVRANSRKESGELSGWKTAFYVLSTSIIIRVSIQIASYFTYARKKSFLYKATPSFKRPRPSSKVALGQAMLSLKKNLPFPR